MPKPLAASQVHQFRSPSFLCYAGIVMLHPGIVPDWTTMPLLELRKASDYSLAKCPAIGPVDQHVIRNVKIWRWQATEAGRHSTHFHFVRVRKKSHSCLCEKTGVASAQDRHGRRSSQQGEGKKSVGIGIPNDKWPTQAKSVWHLWISTRMCRVTPLHRLSELC